MTTQARIVVGGSPLLLDNCLATSAESAARLPNHLDDTGMLNANSGSARRVVEVEDEDGLAIRPDVHQAKTIEVEDVRDAAAGGASKCQCCSIVKGDPNSIEVVVSAA